jgi:hypothetical protein
LEVYEGMDDLSQPRVEVSELAGLKNSCSGPKIARSFKTPGLPPW